MSNSKAGSSATKNDTAKKTNRITAKDRFLASLGGLIVVILSSVPLGMLIVCCWSVGFSSWKFVFISLAFCSPFLVVAGFGAASITVERVG